MIARISKALQARRDALQEQNEKGFTLIELLVVIIIIGILAAIAIPVFLNQREAAWRSEVETDLRNIAIAVDTYATTNGGSFDGVASDAAVQDALDRHAGSDGRKTYTVVDTDSGRSYTISVTHNELGISGAVGWNSATGGFVGWNGNNLNAY